MRRLQLLPGDGVFGDGEVASTRQLKLIKRRNHRQEHTHAGAGSAPTITGCLPTFFFSSFFVFLSIPPSLLIPECRVYLRAAGLPAWNFCRRAAAKRSCAPAPLPSAPFFFRWRKHEEPPSPLSQTAGEKRVVGWPRKRIVKILADGTCRPNASIIEEVQPLADLPKTYFRLNV